MINYSGRSNTISLIQTEIHFRVVCTG